MALYHPGLKVRLDDGIVRTMELTPAFLGAPVKPMMTGPVGLRAAGRFELFRYQLQVLEAAVLPDEEWAVDSPVRLSEDPAVAGGVMSLAPMVPAYTWGRRARGTGEMWTSASVIAWILVKAGIDAARISLPAGGRAPGWHAGLEVARRTSPSTGARRPAP